MIEDLEEGIFVARFERFAVSQDREGVAAAADDKVPREAAVYLPTGASETLLYHFRDHLLAPILRSSVQISQQLL